MNPIRALAERLADRIHARGDAARRAQGLTVQRLPNGHRRVGHPRLAELLEERRRRAVAAGLDPVDRALLDPAAAARLAAGHPPVSAPTRPPARATRRRTA